MGVDPNLITHTKWTTLNNELQQGGLKLVAGMINLIDAIRPDNPGLPLNPIKPLSLKFTGKSVLEKLENVREKMRKKKCSLLVLTALDEIAWLLNLRGGDIEYNPVFFAYVIVYESSFTFFVDSTVFTSEVEEHLNGEVSEGSYEVKPYADIKEVLKSCVEGVEGYIWLSENASIALTSLIPSKRLLLDLCPVAIMKAIKNPVEIQGMIKAHVKDAVALCAYFAWLEENVCSVKVSEISGAKVLEKFRSMQDDYVGLSFKTISAVDEHAAIIHYTPGEDNDYTITSESIYLCDSGGQYLDGTTDVTRTLHFGTPTEFQKECYTRVLKGQLKLAAAVFPSKNKGNCLDSFARQYLWEIGLDYAHGTGHGIGSYLNVHEGPMGISWKTIQDDPGLQAGMFLSNEPGYYEDKEFGIRIEDIVRIVEANVPHNFNNRGFLAFETITLVPKQKKMIVVDMLTDQEIDYINTYHQKCRDIIGPLLDETKYQGAKAWLWRETEPISR